MSWLSRAWDSVSSTVSEYAEGVSNTLKYVFNSDYVAPVYRQAAADTVEGRAAQSEEANRYAETTSKGAKALETTMVTTAAIGAGVVTGGLGTGVVGTTVAAGSGALAFNTAGNVAMRSATGESMSQGGLGNVAMDLAEGRGTSAGDVATAVVSDATNFIPGGAGMKEGTKFAVRQGVNAAVAGARYGIKEGANALNADDAAPVLAQMDPNLRQEFQQQVVDNGAVVANTNVNVVTATNANLSQGQGAVRS